MRGAAPGSADRPSPPPAPRGPPRFGTDDLWRVAALLWIAAAGFLVLSVLSVEWGNDALLGRRDYRGLVTCGERLVHGGNAFADPRLPILTSPVVLPLARLLGALGLRGGYLFMAALGTAGLVAAALTTASLGTARPERRATVALVVATSPAFFLALHLGQASGLYFALLSGALALLVSRRPRAAGLCAALLLAKPHLAAGVAGLALLLEAWPFFLSFAAAGAALAALALPFGAHRWAEWWTVLSETARSVDTHPVDYWKQVTLYAFVRSVLFEVDPGGGLARASLLLSVAGFGTALALAVRRLRPRLPDPAIGARIAAVVVLALSCLNAYLFYYDTLFLALPAAVLVLAAGSWRSAGAHRIAVGCAAILWLLELDFVWDRARPPLVGPVTALWLVLELRDLLGRTPSGALSAPAASPASPPGDRDSPPRADSRRAHR